MSPGLVSNVTPSALAYRFGKRILAAGGEQNVCHSSFVDDMGSQSSSIKV
jgi:hypothetical protein